MAKANNTSKKDNVITKKLVNGTELEIHYAPWGRLETSQESDGTIREVKYDQLGYKLREQIIKPDGSEVEFVYQKDKIIETRLNADGSMDQIERDPKTHEGYSFEYTSKDSDVPNTIRKDRFDVKEESIPVYTQDGVILKKTEGKIHRHTVTYPDGSQSKVIERKGLTLYEETSATHTKSVLKDHRGIVRQMRETDRENDSERILKYDAEGRLSEKMLWHDGKSLREVYIAGVLRSRQRHNLDTNAENIEKYDEAGVLRDATSYKDGKSVQKMFDESQALLCTIIHDYDRGISVTYNKDGKLQSITIKGKNGKEKTRTGFRAKISALMTGTARRLPKEKNR